MAPKSSPPVTISPPKAAPSAPQGTPKNPFSAKISKFQPESPICIPNPTFSTICRSSQTNLRTINPYPSIRLSFSPLPQAPLRTLTLCQPVVTVCLLSVCVSVLYLNIAPTSFAHRIPTHVQRPSSNMGRRQCYAHRYPPPPGLVPGGYGVPNALSKSFTSLSSFPKSST